MQVVRASAFGQVKDAAENIVGKDVVDDVVKAVDPKQGEAPPMNSKTVIVTGGNAGAPLYLTRNLCLSHHTQHDIEQVYFCRHGAKLQNAVWPFEGLRPSENEVLSI